MVELTNGRQCPNCTVVNPGELMICQNCGHSLYPELPEDEAPPGRYPGYY